MRRANISAGKLPGWVVPFFSKRREGAAMLYFVGFGPFWIGLTLR